MDDTANPPRKRQVQEMPILFTEPVGNSIKALVAQRPISQKVDLSKMSFKKKKDTMGVAGPSPIQTAVPALPRRPASTSDHPQSPNVSTPTIGQFSPASVLSPSLSETGCVRSVHVGNIWLNENMIGSRLHFPVAAQCSRHLLRCRLKTTRWQKLTDFSQTCFLRKLYSTPWKQAVAERLCRIASPLRYVDCVGNPTPLIS